MLFGKRKKNERPILDLAVDVGTMGTQMVASTLIGLYIGYKLDEWLGTKPWLLILFLLLGIVAGFRHIIQQMHRLERQEAQRDAEKGNHND